MSKEERYTAYEYKTISVRRDTASMYMDCMNSFGWELAENDMNSLQSVLSALTPANLGDTITNAAGSFTGAADSSAAVELRFKRDRRIENKIELNKLERQCEEALAKITKAERKNNAITMGVSLGSGIIGAAFTGLAVYCLIQSSIALGVVLSIIGAAGWALGYFSNRKVGKKRTERIESQKQQQYDVMYDACEKACALLA